MEYRWFEMLTRDYGLSEAEAKRIGGEMFDNEIWVQGLDGGKLSLEEAIHQYELKYPDDVDVMGWFLRNGEQMAVKAPGGLGTKVAALKEKGVIRFTCFPITQKSCSMCTPRERNS